jgi:transposase
MDNTSISTYSDTINEADWVYNRDKDHLKQINLSLLFGVVSGLPLYSTLCHGSLNDVKTFDTTIKQLHCVNEKKYSLILDKGFFSTNNIDIMLKSKPKITFNISPLKSLKLFDYLITENTHVAKNTESIIITMQGVVLGCTQRILWDNNQYLYAHIYLNRAKKIS